MDLTTEAMGFRTMCHPVTLAVAKITTKKDQNEELRNEIRFAITSDNKDYKSLMGIIAPAVKTQTPPAAAPAANNRPAWAR